MNEADKALLAVLGVPDSLGGTTVGAELDLTDEERQFQEERRSSLGGTDMAAIAGFSSYRNEWDVVAEKKGMLPPWLGNERTEIGRMLEDPVARLYAKRTGERLKRVNAIVRDRELPYLGGHPDRMIIGKKKGVEVKTVQFGFEKYSEPGEPQRIPKDYYVQCQTYMRITGCTSWDLVCLFGLSKVRWYTIQRNDLVISRLTDMARATWERYVLTDEMPPIGPSERAEAWLKERYAREKNITILQASEKQRELMAKWSRARAARLAAEKDEATWKARLQEAIGDCTGTCAGQHVVTWKANKDSTRTFTDWEGIARALYERAAPALESLGVEWTKLLDAFTNTTTSPGARVLREKGSPQ